MKKARIRPVLVTTVLIALFCLFSTSAWSSQEKPIKILFGFMEPPQGPVARVMQEWATDLEEKTKGRVKVNLSLGGALGGPGEYFHLTSKGICDAAACIPAFGGPGLFPMSEMFELPYGIPSGEVASKAMSEWAKKGYLNKEFSAVKLMSVFGAPSDIIFTKDKPITSLADLKGLKIWNPMPIKIEMLKRLGAVPVALPPTDLYSGLQKGVIDGAFCNYMFLFIYKISELVNYSTVGLPSGTVNVASIMNLKTWNNLPPDIMEIIDGMSDIYSLKYGSSFDTAYNLGKAAFIKKGGKELEWKPGELAKANDNLSPIWKKYIEDKEKNGLPARKATGDFYHILKDLGVENPAIGFSPN